MSLYRRRIEARSLGEGDDAEQLKQGDAIERRLRLVALAAEREEITRLMRARTLNDEVGRRLIREVDLMELRYR